MEKKIPQQSPSVWYKAFGLNLSLKTGIYISTLCMLGTVGIYLFFTLINYGELANITHNILDKRIMMMHSAHQIKVALVTYDDAIFRYVATRDPEQQNECLLAQQNARLEMHRLESLSDSAIARSRLLLLESESERYFSDAQSVFEFSKKNNLPEGAGLFTAAAWALDQRAKSKQLELLSAGGKTRLVRVFSLCDELITLNRAALEEAQNDMRERFAQSRRTTWRWGILVAMIIMLVALRLAFALLLPLRALLQGIGRAEQGDLNFEIPIVSLDELGQITSAFNRMTEMIKRQKELLLQETITDGLTGAYNLRHFRNLLKQESDRARRSQRPLSILMIDVDHFKTYNDTQGHEAGSELLKRLCQIIRENVRESDALARYGGDELSLILPDTSPADALLLAQKILKKVVETRFAGAEKMPAGHLTLSIGGASIPQDADSAQDLVAKADEALYEAKRAGRSCVRWVAPFVWEKGHAA